MKRKPAYEMTLAECEERLALVKRTPGCLPQDIEHWQHYVDLNKCGRDVKAANRLAEARRFNSLTKAYKDLTGGSVGAVSETTRSCNCIGPQDGNPVCPCMMAEHTRRAMADMPLDLLNRQIGKPRIRVKAGSHATPTTEPTSASEAV